MNGQEMSDDWRFTKVYVREAQKCRPHEVDDVMSAFGKYPAINRTDDSGSDNKHAHEVNSSLALSEIGLPYYCEQN